MGLVLAVVNACGAVAGDARRTEANMVQNRDVSFGVAVEAEENVYSSRYSNNGASPMWCFNNTCIVRQGEQLFVSGYERAPAGKPLNDCRWVLWQRTADGWQRAQADERGRTREPSPLACLPGGRLLLSANPTLLPPEASGGGPARPELLEFATAQPQAAPHVWVPGWQGQPAFTEHSYRTLAVDAATGEAILFQNAGYASAEWALLDRQGQWCGGWRPREGTDYREWEGTMSHARVRIQ